MSSDKESELTKMIETIVMSGKKTLDDNLMKKIKNICKLSNEYVNFTYHALMTQLRKEHSEIRYSTLLIINELFLRSAVFRQLLVSDMEEFLELVVETDLEKPLPLPKAAAKNLKLKGIEFMQAWTSKFGEKYVRLELALTFLKKCKKVDFNDIEARHVVERERLRQEQERQDRILNERVNKTKTEMSEMTEEITSAVLQMENCFKLLIPPPSEFFSAQDFKEESHGETSETDELKPSEDCQNPMSESDDDNDLRHHGMFNMEKAITIELKEDSQIAVKINEDTQPVVDNLKDLYKEMNSRFYPTVLRWIKVFTKGSNCTDSLKKAIDLKLMIEAMFEKYKDVNLKQASALEDDDDDEDFVEVKEKEGYETETVVEKQLPTINSQPSCSKTMTDAERMSLWKLKHSEEDVNDPTSAASTLSKRALKQRMKFAEVVSEAPKVKQSKKAKLLEKAPVLPYDIDLYHWEEEKPEIPETVKFDSLHKFWESKDEDEENEALKEAQIASLRTRKIDFSGKFEPVKWSCRAPLPSGKLCPRKDRYKCPFHGVIVKRDSSGKTVDAPEAIPGTSKDSDKVPEWQDPELLRDIEAATGINLKIPEKRKKGSKSMKRPKKECGLTNIKKMTNNTRERLSKKIIKRYKHYAKKIDEMERKRFNDKYGDQWNYY